MAKTLLFVHGTGVREDGYKASLAVIERQLGQCGLDAKVASCRWGEKVGARLNFDGASIPTYGDSRGVGVSDADKNRAMWSMLLQDPGFELGLLAGATGEKKAQPPNAAALTNALLAKFHDLIKADDLKPELAALGLDRFWPRVVTDIEKSKAFEAAKTSPLAGKPPHRLALAHAVVAALEKESFESGGPTLDSATREALSHQVARRLGDDARGVFSTLASPFVGLAENIATWQIRRKRTSLTDATYPAAGDILVYQARGEAIRGFIRDELAKLPNDEVFVFAHSLGGIASVEMLIEDRPGNVKGLITFGSQAPFFYEIGALKTLDLEKTRDLADKLPSHFPMWLNFYDLNDPLSYVGGKIFGNRVSDHQVVSDESFPASHSAYLHSKPMWTMIEAWVRNA
ncbi:lipase family protein [Piscinibacter terrae]|uniref:Alpha/beta hydrolase n=1 Tax=Piscinibacter terrae TaxID=2496871 RepID=A0A3N7HJF9_9BURK|nr:hypothetical protein [Albitalea terrae]RQP22188.1 hypothetical protein DZC73_24625 [Albitalea terrae]